MNRFRNLIGFTLAEMLVVMLILTIILAAFAPMMTKRKTVDLSSPWRYTANNSDIYYGLASNQSAMIGQSEKKSNDLASRLILSTSGSNQTHILLKSSQGTPYGMLYAYQDNLLLGGSGISMPSFATHNQSGSGNTSVGINAMHKNSSAGNTAIGNEALMNNTSGTGNTAVGAGALMNSNSSSNTAVGRNAAPSISGSDNVAIGNRAMAVNTGGSYNTIVGTSAFSANTSGDANVAVGYWNLTFNENGSNNTAIGAKACSRVKGSNKTCIGYDSGPSSVDSKFGSDDVERIYIGGRSSFDAGKWELPSLTDGDAVLEVHNTSKPYVVINGNLVVRGYSFLATIPSEGNSYYGPMLLERSGWGGSGNNHADAKLWSNWGNNDSWFVSSDKRLKNIQGENKAGLEKIKELKVYDYTFKKDKEKRPQVGIMAQDLQKVFPDAVHEGPGGYLMIRQDDMFYAMINSIKQLDTFVQGILNEIKVILEKITGVDNRVKVLEQENKQLKEQIQEMYERLEKIEKSSS